MFDKLGSGVKKGIRMGCGKKIELSEKVAMHG